MGVRPFASTGDAVSWLEKLHDRRRHRSSLGRHVRARATLAIVTARPRAGASSGARSLPFRPKTGCRRSCGRSDKSLPQGRLWTSLAMGQLALIPDRWRRSTVGLWPEVCYYGSPPLPQRRSIRASAATTTLVVTEVVQARIREVAWVSHPRLRRSERTRWRRLRRFSPCANLE